MAKVDTVRSRLWLTEAELTAVKEIGADPSQASGDLGGRLAAALKTSGIAVDGAVPGWVDQLLGVVARPQLRIVVETFTVGKPLEHSIWATAEQAVSGTPALDDLIELTLAETTTIPWMITQIVGLGRRPPGPVVPPIQLTASRLAEIEAGLASGDSVAGNGRGGGSLSDQQVHAVTELFRQRRVSWKASSVWTDPAGRRHTKSLSVTDSGNAGLWFVTVDDGEADPVVIYEPTRASVVWEHLVGLLPGGSPQKAEQRD